MLSAMAKVENRELPQSTAGKIRYFRTIMCGFNSLPNNMFQIDAI
jgi:hypothetical protein